MSTIETEIKNTSIDNLSIDEANKIITKELIKNRNIILEAYNIINSNLALYNNSINFLDINIDGRNIKSVWDDYYKTINTILSIENMKSIAYDIRLYNQLSLLAVANFFSFYDSILNNIYLKLNLLNNQANKILFKLKSNEGKIKYYKNILEDDITRINELGYIPNQDYRIYEIILAEGYALNIENLNKSTINNLYKFPALQEIYKTIENFEHILYSYLFQREIINNDNKELYEALEIVNSSSSTKQKEKAIEVIENYKRKLEEVSINSTELKR